MKYLLHQVAQPSIGTNCTLPIILGTQPLWFVVPLNDRILDLELEIECGTAIEANQALLQFEFPDEVFDSSGIGLSKSPRAEIGWYAYLQTRAGRFKQKVTLKLPFLRNELLLGIRTWCPKDSISLWQMAAGGDSTCGDFRAKTTILVSVDVEALPGRAPDLHVDRLIWGGRHNEQGHGVGRLTRIFNDQGVKATFYVDFACCAVHGDHGIFEAARYIGEHGQDVQLHVHSEVLVRNQQWLHDTGAIPTFALHSFSTARRAIDYAAEKYTRCLGVTPRIFRAGGLWWTTDSILATGVCGIAGSSNVSLARRFAPSTDVFAWENGVIELPADFCLDPYIQFGCATLVDDVTYILRNKADRVISCYLHSWSLSPRTAEGFHLEHSATFQENLEEALRILKTLGSLSTSNADYLEQIRKKKSVRRIPLTWGDRHLNVNRLPDDLPSEICCCNICGTVLIRRMLKNDVCPHCRLRTRHRVFRSILDRQLGDIVEGRRVIANHADPNELRYLLGSADSVLNFDVRPLEYLDAVADVQDLSQFKSGSFDLFYSIYVLNHVADDRMALSEMKRVLSATGIAAIMVPFHVGARTRLHSDITQNYGKEALEKYGVGSYRYYGFSDLLRLLETEFKVRVCFAVDSVTSVQDALFICSK